MSPRGQFSMSPDNEVRSPVRVLKAHSQCPGCRLDSSVRHQTLKLIWQTPVVRKWHRAWALPSREPVAAGRPMRPTAAQEALLLRSCQARHQIPKLITRVRFPSPAPRLSRNHWRIRTTLHIRHRSPSLRRAGGRVDFSRRMCHNDAKSEQNRTASPLEALRPWVTSSGALWL